MTSSLVEQPAACLFVDDGLFDTVDALDICAQDIAMLRADHTQRDIAWRVDIGPDLFADNERNSEIVNRLAKLISGRRTSRTRRHEPARPL